MRFPSSARACLAAFVALAALVTGQSVVAQGPPTAMWQASYNHYYSNSTNADSVSTGPTTFFQGWNLRLSTDGQTTATNATISATANASLVPLSAFVLAGAPVQNGPTQFSWTAATLAPGQALQITLNTPVQAVYDRGFDASRTLTGGAQGNQRVVAGGATELRTLIVNVTPQAQDIGYLSTFIQLVPGGPGAKPVIPAVQNCSATSGNVTVSPGTINWFAFGGNNQPMPAQVAIELTCSIAVTNTDPTASLWTPDVSISAGSVSSNAPPVVSSNASFTSDPAGTPPDPLGTVNWTATLPAGALSNLQTSSSRGTTFIGEDRPQNRAPTVTMSTSSATIFESSTNSVALFANAFDADNDPLTYSWQILSFTGNSPGALLGGSGPSSRNYQNADGPSTATVQVTVSDPAGASASATATIVVNNSTPVVSPPLSFGVGLGNSISPCTSVFDQGTLDAPWTVSVDWGDGSPVEQPPMTVGGACFGTGQARTQPSHLYTHAGQFTAKWTAVDKDGSSSQQQSTTVTVNKQFPNVTVSSGPSPATPGQVVTFSMKLTRPANLNPAIAQPTGTVTFSGATIPTTTVPLDGTGTATFQTTTLPVGPNAVQMAYSGDINYQTATNSRSVTVTNQAVAQVTLSGPTSVAYGSTVTYQVAINGFTLPPNGSVTFSTVGPPSQALTSGPIPVLVNGTTGTATFSTQGFGVGTRTVRAQFNSFNSNLQGGSATATLEVLPPAAIPFSQVAPSPAGACICTPVIMNTDVSGASHWFAKAAGSTMTVTAYAHAVNSTDPGAVQVRVRDLAGNQLAVATAGYPANSPNETEAPATVVVPTTAGTVYRVEISTPSTSPLQAHYRLKFEGASAAGTPSPSPNSFESAGGDVPQHWLFNVAAGEQLAVRLFAPSFLNAAPTTVVVSAINLAAPGVPVPLVDPSNPSGPAVTEVNLSNPSGVNTVIRMASAATDPGIYVLLLRDVNNHHRLQRVDPGAADTGIYANWMSGGYGRVRFTVNGGSLALPPSFAIQLHVVNVTSGNVMDTEEHTLPVGVTDIDEADTGRYHITFEAPPGFIVSPSDVEIDVTCDELTEINLTIQAPTTTTLTSSANPSAGPVTFTAAVASIAGTPSVGTVTFHDGATVLGTASVSGGVATLTVPALSLGEHTITASYSGDANYLPSASGPISQLVYAFPAGGGAFVIGDLDAAAGTQVTFWGAQWWKENALSGGAANASFKGYANAVAGGSWSTNPGNSSNPPAGPLPEYMGVIVTNKVNKTGSTISGAVAGIVVVKTNAGYDANPGHAGTGTVVAIVP